MKNSFSREELEGLEYHEIYTLERIRNFNRTSRVWQKNPDWSEILEQETA